MLVKSIKARAIVRGYVRGCFPSEISSMRYGIGARRDRLTGCRREHSAVRPHQQALAVRLRCDCLDQSRNRCRSCERHPNVKVILTSAYRREVIEDLMSVAQVRGFIRKPFQLSDLVRTLGSDLAS